MKKLVVGLFVALAAVASQAEYLWWTVNDNDPTSSYSQNIASYLDALEEGKTITKASQVYAKIVAVDSQGNEMGTYEQGFTSKWGTGTDAQKITMEQLLGGNFDDRANYSYYIEICSSVSGYENIGKNNDAYTYEQLSASITTEDLPPAQSAVWHGGGADGYRAAPEPTSAMLMLLGVAGLALKRKQKKA